MSSASKTSSLVSNFEILFDTALAKYAKRTGQDLRNHPLAAAIDRCQSPDSILAIFQEQSQAFDEFRNGDPQLIKWLGPVVNGLHAISTNTVLSDGASLVSPNQFRASFPKWFDSNLQAFPPANIVFSGIGVLLSVSVTLDLSV